MARKFFLILAVLCLTLPLSSARAGITGKISGRVTDDKGAVLPGVSVALEGTRQGAVTDKDGFYAILSVGPGSYSLTASLIGFNKVTKRDVRVAVDYTTTVDFRLKEEALEAAEVVVTAERPPVEKDKTSTKYMLTVEDIQQTPLVKTTAEFLSLQPGVDQAGTFSIRGSDINWGAKKYADNATWSYGGSDVYVMIDGVRVPNNDGNQDPLFTGVNRSAVQQISIETGVTPAEYGDAQGGTINIVTQDGQKDFHGWMEANYDLPGQKHWGANVYDAPIHRNRMRWNDQDWLKETDPLTGRVIHVREDYTNLQGGILEGNLSGPLGRNASFMVSMKHQRRPAIIPSPSNHGFFDDRGKFINSTDFLQGSASLTFRPTANTKVKLGAILQRYTAFQDELNEWGFMDDGYNRGMLFVGRNIFMPEGKSTMGRFAHREELVYATFTQTLSPRTFYEVRIAHSRTKEDTLDVPPFTLPPRRDQAGWFNVDRQVRMFNFSDRKRLSIKADLSSQITKGNFVKAGVEVVRYDAYGLYWAGIDKSDNQWTFYSGGDRPWDYTSGARPIRGAVYAQDKMEFEGLIVNAGVRLDFNKHTHKELIRTGLMQAPMFRHYTTRPFAYGQGTGEGVTVSQDFVKTPPTQFRVSPRLGISHPITDRAVMRFSMGRFVQWIELRDSYVKSYQDAGVVGPDGDPTWLDLNGNRRRDPAENLANMVTLFFGSGGDAWLHPEETLTFEVGADWNFVSDYNASLTVFYRNETQQVQRGSATWQAAKPGTRTQGQSNGRAGYAKGIELAVNKRMSNYFSFRASWTSQWTAVGSMGISQFGGGDLLPDSLFVAGPNFWYNYRVGADGTRIPIPLTAAEKAQIGNDAQRVVRSWTTSYANDPYLFFGKVDELRDKTIYVRYGSLGGNTYGPFGARGEEKVGGINGQANVQFLVNTPSGVRFGPRWMSWLVSDLSANILWKMRMGTRFFWTPPAGGRRIGYGPTDTVADLGLEKTFNAKGRVKPAFFVEVRNLFNDRVDMDQGTDYTVWGLQMARPTDTDFVNYGDFGDRGYFNAPRQTKLGMRLTF